MKNLDSFARHLLHEKMLSERTVETYLKSLSALYKEYGEILNIKTYKEISNLIIKLKDDRKWSDRTTYKVACEVTSYFNWAFREGIIPESPMRLGHQFKRSEKTQMDFFDWDSADFKRLIYNPNNSTRDNALFHVLRSSGPRAGEICALKIKDVDLDERWLRIPKGKTGERFAPFDLETKDWLSIYIPQIEKHSTLDWLFQNEDFTKPLNPSTLYKIIYRKALKLGIKANPQKFRRSLGGEMIYKGAELPVVQQVLGHKRASTTADYYVKFPKKKLQEQYDKFVASS